MVPKAILQTVFGFSRREAITFYQRNGEHTRGLVADRIASDFRLSKISRRRRDYLFSLLPVA